MTDWPTIASFATAGGTLVLAGATFFSVRLGNRAARSTERALLAGLLPVLVPSRPHDPPEKIRFADDHWVLVNGGHATVEIGDEAIYLAVALRNVGQGLAVLDRWALDDEGAVGDNRPDVREFRRLTRDLYVPAGDLGFWQGTFRDTNERAYLATRTAIVEHRALTLDLLYGDHEGGQRTVTRFVLTARGDSDWLASASRHWRLDQADPR